MCFVMNIFMCLLVNEDMLMVLASISQKAFKGRKKATVEKAKAKQDEKKAKTEHEEAS